MRNLPYAATLTASQLDVYSLLSAKKVVVTKDGLEGLKARMKKPEVAE